jgi:cytoskeletal protein CcmA (bactofilin family)
VAAREVIIEGRLDGSVDAEETVKLCASSRVKGELSAKKVAIDEGAFFDGRVHMRGSAGKASGQ